MLLWIAALVAAGSKPIVVSDQNGKMVAPLAHGPVALFYVMTECPIARKFSPEMARLAREFPSVRFYAVQTERETTPAQARAHRKEFSLPFPELLDRKRELVSLAGVEAVPTAVLFDARGRLVYRGRIDDRFPALGVQREKATRRDLRIAISETLVGKPVSLPRTTVIGCSLSKY